MKRILLVLFVLVSVSSVFAADLKVSGDFYMRGTTLNNTALAEEEEAQYSYFDYDLNLDMVYAINENAKVVTKLTYDKDVVGSGAIAMGDAAADDAALAVERAYVNYKFHEAFQVDAGLMSGGQWGTVFGNTEVNITRVKLVGALSKEMVFLYIYQKNDEQGALIGEKDAEKDDTTTHYLASVLTFGPVKLSPLLVYATKGISGKSLDAAYDYDAKYAEVYEARLIAGDTHAVADGTADATVAGTQAAILAIDEYTITTKVIDVALTGDFGMVGFESEIVYTDVDTDKFAEDSATAASIAAAKGIVDKTTLGAYVNVFAKVDAFKAGFVYAYGSADEKDGKYNWGDDFDVLTVMDDYVSNTATGLEGFTVYKVYADATFGALTASAAVGYGANNADYETTKDATFTEIDAGVSYAFDANTTYTIAGGYAMTSDFDTVDVDADAYRVYHKLAVKF